MDARQSSEESLARRDTVPSSSDEERAGPEFMPIQSNGRQLDNAERNGLRRVDSTAMMEETDVEALRRIATDILAQRRQSEATIPELRQELTHDPAYDPSSKQFDLGKFLRKIIGELQEEGIELKQVGVAYKDLGVSGTGAALQLQHTVGSMLQAPLRLGEHFSFKKKEPKTILHNFDGVIKSGEMLIVLGRPGSGCSTLLKTITGEHHGLTIAPETVIHYNGIPQKEMMKEFKGEAIYNQEVCSCLVLNACTVQD